MTDRLPAFRFHPDPLATGSIVQSGEICERCGQARGFVYVGPIFAVDEVEFLCPWCIADGSAAHQFDAQFTDVAGAPSDVAKSVLEEVARRTPGFSGWQQEQWMFHCGDAAAFLGRAGATEVANLPGATESLLSEGWRQEDLRYLGKDGDLTAYLFR